MSNFNSADIAAFKDVWVFCEQREGKLMPTDFELISKGRDLANELGVNLCGLLLGGEGIESAAKELGGYGADKVIVCESPLLATYTTDAYAKDICENYRMDLRRYKLIRERKQYIGISNREAYQAMCEDLAFAQQSLKTVLNDYAALFRKRFSEGLSIRKAADAMQQNRGVIERRQAALYRAFAQLLQQRDEADGVYRLMQKTEYDQRDIEDLLE